MSTSDFLKTLLEKKKSQTKQGDRRAAKDGDPAVHGSQVSVNKPARKSAGRGR